MARIEGVRPEAADPYARKLFEAQTRTWGAPLAPHLVYARLPSLYRGVQGMWQAVGSLEGLGTPLVSLLNRRVAGLNGCVF